MIETAQKKKAVYCLFKWSWLKFRPFLFFQSSYALSQESVLFYIWVILTFALFQEVKSNSRMICLHRVLFAVPVASAITSQLDIVTFNWSIFVSSTWEKGFFPPSNSLL